MPAAEVGTEIRAIAAMLAQLSGCVVAHPPGTVGQLSRLDASMPMLTQISALLFKVAAEVKVPVSAVLQQAKKKNGTNSPWSV